MATKSNPGPNDCYDKAEPDEPMFVLLARDRHALALVWLWATLRELDGEDPAVVAEARECAVSMLDWSSTRGRKMHGMGVAGVAAMFELIRAANFGVEQSKTEATNVELVRAFLCRTIFEQPHAEPPAGADI